MASDQEHKKKEAEGSDTSIDALFDYCSEHAIRISKKLTPRRVPGRGLGIFCKERILRGERLIYIPNKQLFTIDSIPKTFLPKDQQSQMPVHALLAAYFTLGLKDDDHQYAPWTATWPSLLDFTTSMPLFWPSHLCSTNSSKDQAYSDKRARTTASAQQSRTSSLLPPALTDAWSPPSIAASGAASSVALLQMKLQNHLSVVASVFPEHSEALLSAESALHWRFIHNWCCVNTRCFFHPTESSTSKTEDVSMDLDPNECLALAPGMDLFNHAASDFCHTKFNSMASFIVANRRYNPGEEIFISYGSHSNDQLWAEWGFMLPDNDADGIEIDEIISRYVTTNQKPDLARRKDGEERYWLSAEGVSESAKHVAREVAMREGHPPKKTTYTPEWTKMLEKKAATIQIEWILDVQGECERSVKHLRRMRKDEIITTFGDDLNSLKIQGVKGSKEKLEAFRSKQAVIRHNMCTSRWGQIYDMTQSALRVCEEANPGCSTREAGRGEN